MPVKRLTPLLLLLLLAGCEQVSTLLELPDPQKEAATAEAEGKAIGGACRHSGRSLEDCYLLNPEAQKASVFAGWREMNDYMMQHNMETVPSQLRQPFDAAAPVAPKADVPDAKKTAHARVVKEEDSSRRSRPTL